MMDGAYFVGRKDLLEFFNDLLDLEYSKIEQSATGAMACQLTSLIFPGSIPMSRVQWDGKADYEFVANYKLLQNAFAKHKVQRYVDVTKLIRGKYQDNLEFCQWLKAFYDQSGAMRPDDYDAALVRTKGKGGTHFNAAHSRTKGKRKPAASSSRAAATTARPAVARTTTARTATRPTVPKEASSATARSSRPLRDRDNQKSSAVDNSAEVEALNTKNQSLTTRVLELEESLVALEEERDVAVLEVEKERDFYFTKLRDVEVLLQIHQEQGTEMPAALMDHVFAILYATAEEDLTVTEDGEVMVNAQEAAVEESVGAD
jgi:RP/EB family microtubule-associated protein